MVRRGAEVVTGERNATALIRVAALCRAGVGLSGWAAMLPCWSITAQHGAA
jgi:hypothetical protein